MKKLFRSVKSRFTNIPAIDVDLESSDPYIADISVRLNTTSMPLHRRIKADREFGIKSDVYPYESTYDDDSDVQSQNVDVQADMRRSKWTTYAEACLDNASRVKQSEEAPVTSGAEKESAATDGDSSAE